MADRPANLPEYDDPPVVEVVLSVQFSELQNFRTVHAGLLWDRKFRRQFRTVIEKPKIDSKFEAFGPQSAGEPRIQIIPILGPPLPRLWFAKPNMTELIQIQDDRFIHNWRKVKIKTVYPRYEKIKRKFFREVSIFQDFLEDEQIGSIEPNQCEVTYVNHIELSGVRNVNTLTEKIFRQWSRARLNSSDLGARLPELEDVRFSTRYIIRDNEDNPIGRLMAVVHPIVIDGDRAAVSFELTARGAPITSDLKGVSDFFDIGRDVIVRGFTALTTPRMHEVWKRTR